MGVITIFSPERFVISKVEPSRRAAAAKEHYKQNIGAGKFCLFPIMLDASTYRAVELSAWHGNSFSIKNGTFPALDLFRFLIAL